MANKKINGGQADDVVINLVDSKATVESLREAFRIDPPNGNIYVIDQDGRFIQLAP